VGPVSANVIDELRRRGVLVPAGQRFPLQARAGDLAGAARIIALCEREHRPLVQDRFSAFAARVEYWQVEDQGITDPVIAFGEIARRVEVLMRELGPDSGPLPRLSGGWVGRLP
jgi:protein-tyrosine phosphatase